MEKLLISSPQSHTALAGDVYEFTYKTIGIAFFDKFQQDIIKRNIEKNKKLNVTNIESNRGSLIIRVVVVENPLPLAIVLLGIRGAVAGIVGLFIYLSLNKVEQIVNTPEGKVNNLATTLGVAVGAVTLGALFMKGK